MTRTPALLPAMTSIALCLWLLAACGGGGDAAEPTAAEGGTAVKTAAAAGPAEQRIDPADIAVEARPALPLARQRWGTVQCMGRIAASQEVPEAGIVGPPLGDGEALRFGRVADPLAPGSSAFRFTLDVADPPTASSHRCELALSGARGTLPRDRVFWHAFGVLLSDQSGTTDEQALAQWHAGDDSGGLLPIYTLLQRGNRLRLVLRHDTSATPSRTTTTTLVVWQSDLPRHGRWLTFVTQAQLNPHAGGGGFLRAWLDGRLIVDHAGPVGYDHPTATPYVKHGLYHWVDASNPWSEVLPTRTVWQRRPLVVLDPQRRYTSADLAAAVDLP